MAQPYSIANVAMAIRRIAEKAVELELEKIHWFPDGAGGFRASGWQESLPPIGAKTGTIRLRYLPGGLGVRIAPPGAKLVQNLGDREFIYECDPWTSIYNPWIEGVNGALEGLMDLPDPAEFDRLIPAMQAAVGSLTPLAPVGGRGSDMDGDKFSSADLASDLDGVNEWIGGKTPGAFSGDTIYAFRSSYGAARIQTVLVNQAHIAMALGAVLQGEKNIWTQAREDTMVLLEQAERAFDPSGSSVTVNLKVVSALIDIVGAFVPEAYKTALGVGAKLVGLVGEVFPKAGSSPAPVETSIKGSTASEVYGSMCGAYIKLCEQVEAREKELDSALNSLLDIMARRASSDFHLHPEAGVDPGLESGRIEVNPKIMGDLGYNVIPRIASTMARAAESASRADSPWTWHRSRVGLLGDGPYPAWQMVLGELDKVATGSAAELTNAGHLLAQAAGALRDVDEKTAEATGGLQDELNRGAAHSGYSTQGLEEGPGPYAGPPEEKTTRKT